ncbi:glycerol kinase GlpK [Herminiimonas sp. CN]|uniref:glycerol kinase GlpK n=1 Tax=Herminiimonas sp. CN TaxID=1349818 RepID=UPI000473E193|nr:glycerol kinase GlpK [Herminiimonas sp. CN]
MAYLLAMDQGTSSSRSIIFNQSGVIVAQARQEFRQHFPQPGWVEHDPLELWQSQIGTARRALADAGLAAGDISALGIANQRETTVVWERSSGQPICNAIVWQDRRTEPICAALRVRGLAAPIQAKTGLVLDPYFSGTKLQWILQQVPGARARAERGELAFGTVDAWLIWNLTDGGEHVTDVTNASRTMLWNIHDGCWDDELLAWLEIPRRILPQVRPSSHRYGSSSAHWLGAPVAIGGVAGDQQAALFGQACFSPGIAKNTYGTGCFMLLHTGDACAASQHGLISTAACQLGARPQYALEGSVFIGGAVVQWLRDGLGAIRQAADIEALAASVPDAGGVVFVPAFTGLGAPYWVASARGAIVGLSRGSTIAHIAHAALESIAFQSAALLAAMVRDAVSPIAALRVDGGAAANNLLLQFQADLLGLPVIRPQVTETTALGAAYLAGLAVGVYQGLPELSAHWRIERTFLPAISRDQAAALMWKWEAAIAQVTPV